MRRLLAGVLAVAVAFSMPGTSVLAQDNEDIQIGKVLEKSEIRDDAVTDSSGKYKYNILGSSAEIYEYIGNETNVVVPAYLDGYRVIAIDELSFGSNNTIQSVVISEGISTIEYSAFYNCDNLTSITIPASVVTLGQSAFGGCAKLSSINLASGNSSFKVMDGVLFTADGTKILQYPVGNGATSYTIPSGVTTIGNSAFDDASTLVSITIPDTVKKLEEYAFNNCWSLKAVTLPTGINLIPQYAFAGCTGLESVVIPEGVTNIDNYAFNQCMGLKSVTIPLSVTNIASYAFRNCYFITDVYYGGTAQDWSQINIYSGNERIKSATKHYQAMKAPVLAATSSGGVVTLTWDAVSGAVSYNVYRADSPTGNKIQIGTVTGTAFSDSSIADGQTYYYYVMACGSSWDEVSDYSNAVQITINFALEQFVARMYTIALGRGVDPTGHADWVGGLINGTYDGATVGRGIFLSPEFVNFNLGNDEFLNRLYRTFFNREPDEGGKQNWMNHLNAGFSREYVLAHFINSEEFTNLCNDFNVERGVMMNDGNAVNIGVPKFVTRLYSSVFGRTADWQGYTNWTMELATKAQTPEQVGTAFFASQEYLNKNVSNEQYVRDLYSVFLNRTPDSAGLADWVNQLNSGTPRASIIPGFSNSGEFKAIAASYGL